MGGHRLPHKVLTSVLPNASESVETEQTHNKPVELRNPLISVAIDSRLWMFANGGKTKSIKSMVLSKVLKAGGEKSRL